MWRMDKIVISDTSCLILLSKIGRLELLQKLYKSVFITPEIKNEFNQILPDFIEILEVKDKQKQLLLEFQIDKGESSGIALALEIPDAIIILDDNKARKIARKLSLNVTGTLGVIINAKKRGFIDDAIKILEEIKKTDFRISEELEKEFLFLNDEL